MVYRLTKTQRTELINVLAVQSAYRVEGEMVHYTMNRITALGATVWFDRGNVYAVKGTIPDGHDGYPCFVAHLDTVHTVHHPSRYRVHTDAEGRIVAYDPSTNKLTGVGGDDKVGIFIALWMLKTQPAAKVALFSGEEMGCIGAGMADMTFFDDVTHVIECDRRGNTDIVNEIGGSLLFGDEWLNVIQPALTGHEYKLSPGLITDVGTLAHKALPVVACNLSCGYYNPHMHDEYIVPRDVARCLSLVQHMTALTGGKKFAAPEQTERWHAKSYRTGNTFRYNGYFDDDERDTYWPDTTTTKTKWPVAMKRCQNCDEYLFDNGLCPRCDVEFCPACPTCGGPCEESDYMPGRGWCESCKKFVDIIAPAHELDQPEPKGDPDDLGVNCPTCGELMHYLGEGMDVCNGCDVLYVAGKPYAMNDVRETAAYAELAEAVDAEFNIIDGRDEPDPIQDRKGGDIDVVGIA